MLLFVFLYFVSFIRTVLIIAIVILGIRLFVRYVFPLILSRWLNNLQGKMDNSQQQQQSHRPEGEVTIEGQSQNSQHKKTNNEEYVDFEEVD